MGQIIGNPLTGSLVGYVCEVIPVRDLYLKEGMLLSLF
jgi:hypothetical protein